MTGFKDGKVVKREVELDDGELGKKTYTVELSAKGIVMRRKGHVSIDGEATWREISFLLRRWTRSRI